MRKSQGPPLGAQPDFQGLCARRPPVATCGRTPASEAQLPPGEAAAVDRAGRHGGRRPSRRADSPEGAQAQPCRRRVSGDAATRAPSPAVRSLLPRVPVPLAAQAGCRATCFQAHLRRRAPRCPAADEQSSQEDGIPVPGTEPWARRMQAVHVMRSAPHAEGPRAPLLSPSLASLRSQARFPTEGRQHPLALGKGVQASWMRSEFTF